MYSSRLSIEVLRTNWNGLTSDFICPACIVPKCINHKINISYRICVRLAIVQGLQFLKHTDMIVVKYTKKCLQLTPYIQNGYTPSKTCFRFTYKFYFNNQHIHKCTPCLSREGQQTCIEVSLWLRRPLFSIPSLV